MRILLAGQPNCGKTTLFNRLTGRREHTGNRAGVTVSCARARLRGREEELVDLPGLYSLTGGGPDEQAARRALETEKPDLILNVVDSTALQRSLVLTLQLLALGRPTAVLLNMADEARQRGIAIDRDRLSKMLGVPVFPVSARTGEGLGDVDRLLQAGRISARRPSPSPEELYREAGRIASAVLSGNTGGRPRGADRLLLHPFWGLPVFGLILGLLFLLTFQWVGPWLGRGVEAVVDGVKSSLSETILDTPLVKEGLLGSLGYVLSFLPVITVLSLLLNLLEDVGYLPRAAFLLDGFLRGLGLDGRCAVPLLLGFGCTVPAVMATRTLPEGGKRRRTMALLPFVPCSARLPFLLLLGSVLLPEHPARGALLFYGLSLCLGIAYGALTKGDRGEGGFYLELPPLRMPRWQSVVKETGAHVDHFLRRAGKLLLPAALVLWLSLQVGPNLRPVGPGDESLLAALGRLLLPLLRPLGLTDGRMGVILLSGLGAKETMASAAALLLGEGMTLTVEQTLVLGTVALLLPPCLGTLAAVREEAGRKQLLSLVLRHVLLAWSIGALMHFVLHFLI
ncbi:MAG: ferrous iron transporter B [Clostridia bacterium]|nr:ferrous iron transporter B [Clostridia bacterium]